MLDVPHFGPTREIHTVSVSDINEIKIEINQDPQLKRSLTSLDSSKHMRK